MRPLALEEILPVESFEAVRPLMREALMRHKASRRVPVGDYVTLVFEDRETVRWQVQEMCRVEGIRDTAAIQGELDVYNELVPGDGELSATLFVEITDAQEIRPELDRLIGIDEHVGLRIGNDVVPARFDSKQMDEDRISAVHYLRFGLDETQRRDFADPDCVVALVIDHRHYEAECFLAPATRASLGVDLDGEPAPLVDPTRVPAPAEPEVLHETQHARLVRPARPRAPGHLIAEAKAPTSFLDADPALLAAVLSLAQQAARDIHESEGACLLVIDTEGALRVHLHAPPS